MLRINSGQDEAPLAHGAALPPFRREFPAPSSAIESVHRPACSIWDTPREFQPDALLKSGIKDEAVASYLSDTRPLYDAAKRCVSQLSGILLLLQTDSLDRNRNDLLLASVTRQLREATDRLGAVKAPPTAARHQAALADLLVLLGRILSRLDRLADLIDPASPDLDAVVDALFFAQRSLRMVSEPSAGLTPVDFRAACCNCRPAKN